MSNSDEEFRRALVARRDALDDREAKIQQREDRLIDNITMQAVMIILLRTLRKNGKIKPADLNEIRFARSNWQSDDYNPELQLQRILAETFLDKEERRPTPQKTG